MNTALPSLCVDCAANLERGVCPGCAFCRDAELPEPVLCDLNRSVQDPRAFSCHAFRQPRLRLVVGERDRRPETPPEPRSRASRRGEEPQLHSDRLKYQWALARQTLERFPDAVICDLRYHLAWNTAERRPLLQSIPGSFEAIHKAFEGDAEAIGGAAALMYLATDHVHAFVESDGELSVETIVRQLKQTSLEALGSLCRDKRPELGLPTDLWDDSYFAGTVG